MKNEIIVNNKKMSKDLYVILETSALSHNVIYLVRARSIDEAIEVFFRVEIPDLQKMKNGRFRWGKDYYDSIKDLLEEYTDLAFEVRKVQSRIQEPVDEILCSINWGSVLYTFKESFPGAQKIGRFYEWYSRDSKFYAFFINPKYLSRKFKDLKIKG